MGERADIAEVHYPFECPICGLRTGVFLRGTVPHFIPDSTCIHAISPHRDAAGRVVVEFAGEEG